jgi:arylsulfatase A-like enzyme
LRWGFVVWPILLGVLLYLPAMQGQFLMSDLRVLVENPRLTSLHGLASIWWPTATDPYPVLDQYQPLTYTLFWLEHQLFALEPRAYQAVSLALHTGNALLVFGLLSRIGARGAAVAAALFGLHAVHVESVAWIYEQKNLLSGVFFFLALRAYLEFDASRRRSQYAAALALFAAALLSKASTVMLPAVLLLYAWFLRRPWSWKSLAPTLPFFALGALMAALTVWHEGAVTGATGELYSAGVLERVVRAGWVVGFHAGTLLFPIRLAFFYPAWSIDPSDWAAYVPGLAIAGLLLVLWLRRDGWGRPSLLGVGWYLLLMFPVMGFFDIYYHRFSLAADHFQYLASVGLIGLLAHAGAVGLERIGATDAERGRTRLHAAGRAAVALLIGVLWITTLQRTHVFANDGLLARDAAAKYPTSWIAFQKSAEYSLKQAVRNPQVNASLLQRAAYDLEHALSLRADHPQIHDSLGTAYALLGRAYEARRQMEIAVAADPQSPIFRRNLAGVLEQLNETERAVVEYRALLATAPDLVEGHLLLGRALVRAGRHSEGARVLEEAIERASGLAAANASTQELLRQARTLRTQALARVKAEASGTADPTPHGPHWNVLLVTVDTLRPDYLSSNGYPLPTSPFLDRLLGEGFYFEQALAPVPRTTPALASLVTGAYPHKTRVRTLADRLPSELVTLAEALRAEGYQTVAVVTNLLLAAFRSLDAGFDVYDAAFDVRDASRTTDAALRHLEVADLDKPLFAWVHYIDPHVPYHPDRETAERFDPDYAGRFRLGFGRQPRAGEPDDLFREFPEGLRKSQVTHRNPLTRDENEHIRRLYAGEIRTVDAQIERLVDAVRERFPRTVIVFTADHGESLGEHAFYFDHGDYVYNASSRVPLGFVLPAEHPWHGAGRRSGWVSLVDVAPTLFDLIGLSPPPEMAVLFEGRSLAPALRGQPMPPAPVFIESGTSFFPELVRRRQRNDQPGRFRAVVQDDWKLIWTPFLPDTEAWELYDLGSDPNETQNLYRHRADPARLAGLKRNLDAWLALGSAEPTPTRALSDADRDALRRLGYLE